MPQRNAAARKIRWILFTALMLTAPSVLFLFVVVLFVPAVFFPAGMVVVAGKLLTTGNIGETVSFLTILGFHILAFGGFYYGLAYLCARAITMATHWWVQTGITAGVCAGLVGMTQLPIYGGGGHGPIRWVTLFQLWQEISRDYGAWAVPIVYGAAVAITVGLIGRRTRKNP